MDVNSEMGGPDVSLALIDQMYPTASFSSFWRPEGEKKKRFFSSPCVLFFLPSLKRIRETKQTQTHVRTHRHRHTRKGPCNKKKKFRAPTFRDQKRKEKAAQTYCCWFLLLLTFSPPPPPLDGLLCLYDTLKRLFYALTSS